MIKQRQARLLLEKFIIVSQPVLSSVWQATVLKKKTYILAWLYRILTRCINCVSHSIFNQMQELTGYLVEMNVDGPRAERTESFRVLCIPICSLLILYSVKTGQKEHIYVQINSITMQIRPQGKHLHFLALSPK